MGFIEFVAFRAFDISFYINCFPVKKWGGVV